MSERNPFQDWTPTASYADIDRTPSPPYKYEYQPLPIGQELIDLYRELWTAETERGFQPKCIVMPPEHLAQLKAWYKSNKINWSYK
jgi:hypothetical protein